MPKTNESLFLIDRLILDLSKGPELKVTLQLFKEMCCAMTSRTGSEAARSKGAAYEKLFDEKMEANDKRFIAVCMLRVYNANSEIFKELNIERQTFKLFDAVFSKDIYPELKLREDDQTFKKESNLKGVGKAKEKELTNLITSLDNLSLVSELRGRLMRLMHGAVAKALFYPFLPRELLSEKLGEIFRLTEEYANDRTAKSFASYRNALEAIESYHSAAMCFDTQYSKIYLGRLSQKLMDLIKDYFEKSPLSKPADVTVKRYEKRYPFHIPNNAVDISVLVENMAPGTAFEVALSIETSIETLKSEFYVGEIKPHSCIEIQVPCRVNPAQKDITVIGEARWKNFDGSCDKREFELFLESQSLDIDWDTLKNEDPYSLEPVKTEDELVGRREILDRLQAMVLGKKTGSAFLFGQKRVGKTSIARTLQTKLGKSPSKIVSIYLEAGEYIDPDPEPTIRNLGQKIIASLRSKDARIRNLPIPEFQKALSPLVDYLKDVFAIDADLKVLITLDEFDALPQELYRPGKIAGPFFSTLRSLGGLDNVGIILIGGENMQYIVTTQGDQINKFQKHRVDYFDRDKSWPDFQALIRNPVRRWFQVDDEALEVLYNEVAGNPFFAKLICRELFSLMVLRKDSHVTRREAEEAVRRTLGTLGCHQFQHFWTDAISTSREDSEDKILRRIKVILSLAEILRHASAASKQEIADKCSKDYELSNASTDIELREFEVRQILIKNDDYYTFKVNILNRWLTEDGLGELLASFANIDSRIKQKEREEAKRVSSEDILALAGRFGPYKSKRISEDNIRAWLNQFPDNRSQRLMAMLLKGVRYYSQGLVRAKMKEANGIVKRNLIWKKEPKQRKRGDILISYLDRPGKSGSYLARLYAEENNIYMDNVIDKSSIEQELALRREENTALVFIDDFVGTGDSACQYLRELNNTIGKSLGEIASMPGTIEDSTRLQMYFVGINGFLSAKDKIEKELDACGLNMNVHLCDLLTEADRVFSDKSLVFPNEIDRKEALRIAYEYGQKLVKDGPLGYGDCQAAIVFEHSCPNNSLPILWQEGKEFTPLFPR